MHAATTPTCPACGRPRGPGAECHACGLIYARWRPRPVALELAERRVHLSLRQQERLYLGLATALASGMAPLTFLEAAGAALPAQLLSSLRADANEGVPLSETFGRLGLLEGADLAFLQAGELQGSMPASLRLLARRAADRRKDRGRILLALAYPILLGLAAVVIVPVPLIFRLGFAAYAARVLPVLAGVAIVGFVALVLLPRMGRDAGPRRFLRRAGLLLPATSHALRNGSIATFLDVLGSCASAGLPIRQALPLAADAAPHPAFRNPAPLRLLDDGATLSACVAALRIVPPASLAQIGQAELSGTLDRVLPALAQDHRRRARAATLVGVAAVGILAAGTVVAVLAWSVIEAWLAYFNQIAKAAG